MKQRNTHTWKQQINNKQITVHTRTYPVDNEFQLQMLADYLNEPSQPDLKGTVKTLGELPSGSLITEEGLANILGRCKATIKNAVVRKELPRPIRFMGKNTWTVDFILQFFEKKLSNENKRFSKLSPYE